MSEANPQPLSIYTERLPQVRRTFRLFKDRVEIDARWTVGKDYQTTIQLRDLKPNVSYTTVRNRWFKKSIMIGSMGVAAAVGLTHGDFPIWIKNLALLGWPIAMACCFIAIRSFRKRRFARFVRKDGKPGLDFCNSGPDIARFEDFVSEVQRCIRNA